MTEENQYPQVILCGVSPEIPHPTEFSVDGKTCPKCGAKAVERGYGLMGGGIGSYELCDTDACDWFAKQQDEP